MNHKPAVCEHHTHAAHHRKMEGIRMGNLIVGAVLIAAVAFVIRGMVRDKKNGKSLQCGCGCSHCSGHCTESKK